MHNIHIYQIICINQVQQQWHQAERNQSDGSNPNAAPCCCISVNGTNPMILLPQQWDPDCLELDAPGANPPPSHNIHTSVKPGSTTQRTLKVSLETSKQSLIIIPNSLRPLCQKQGSNNIKTAQTALYRGEKTSPAAAGCSLTWPTAAGHRSATAVRCPLTWPAATGHLSAAAASQAYTDSFASQQYHAAAEKRAMPQRVTWNVKFQPKLPKSQFNPQNSNNKSQNWYHRYIIHKVRTKTPKDSD